MHFEIKMYMNIYTNILSKAWGQLSVLTSKDKQTALQSR